MPDQETYGLRRIVVPTDFAEPAAAALATALALSRSWRAQLRLMHVFPLALPATDQMAYLPGPPSLDPVSRARLTAELHRFAKPAAQQGVETQCILREGDPSEEIVAEARHSDADLVAMGRHGRGLLDRLLVGSVTETVVATAPCPVLVVSQASAAPPEMPRRILCAVDLRAASAGTLAHAVGLARGQDAELSVLHVVEDEDEPQLRNPFDVVEHGRLMAEEAREALNALASDALSLTGRVERRVARGTAYRRILQSASEGRTDLLVVGSHSGEDNARGALGRTVRHVVREARCPVLVVPARIAVGHAKTERSERVLVWK
jgi:nucleotide-binding universal stress UspA family protein